MKTEHDQVNAELLRALKRARVWIENEAANQPEDFENPQLEQDLNLIRTAIKNANKLKRHEN